MYTFIKATSIAESVIRNLQGTKIHLFVHIDAPNFLASAAGTGSSKNSKCRSGLGPTKSMLFSKLIRCV